jgi:hypothetical protein
MTPLLPPCHPDIQVEQLDITHGAAESCWYNRCEVLSTIFEFLIRFAYSPLRQSHAHCSSVDSRMHIVVSRQSHAHCSSVDYHDRHKQH